MVEREAIDALITELQFANDSQKPGYKDSSTHSDQSKIP